MNESTKLRTYLKITCLVQPHQVRPREIRKVKLGKSENVKW